jgi:hypothetical protein
MTCQLRLKIMSTELVAPAEQGIRAKRLRLLRQLMSCRCAQLKDSPGNQSSASLLKDLADRSWQLSHLLDHLFHPAAGAVRYARFDHAAQDESNNIVLAKLGKGLDCQPVSCGPLMPLVTHLF